MLGTYILFVPLLAYTWQSLLLQLQKQSLFWLSGSTIDIDHDGYIFGIEFLDRTDFLTELRMANVL